MSDMTQDEVYRAWVEHLSNYLAGFNLTEHYDQIASDLMDIGGIGDLLKLRDEKRLAELDEDQTPPTSYWSHGVEIPIAPEVSSRYFEHVWMKVKGLASGGAEEKDDER